MKGSGGDAVAKLGGNMLLTMLRVERAKTQRIPHVVDTSDLPMGLHYSSAVFQGEVNDSV